MTQDSPQQRSRLRVPWQAVVAACSALLVLRWLVLYSGSTLRGAETQRVQAALRVNAAVAASTAEALDNRARSLSRGLRTGPAPDAGPGTTQSLARAVLVGWEPARLRSTTDAGLTLVVVDPSGRPLASLGAAVAEAGLQEQVPELAALARQKGPGAQVVPPGDPARGLLVGFAPAPTVDCVVLVAEPGRQALAAENRIVAGFINMALPALALIGLAAWAITALYNPHRELARRLAESNLRLEEASRAKSDFLANVSHDLRTPLAALRVSIAGLLAPGIEWDEALVRQSLQTASDQVEQLAARVRNLLVISRFEAGAQQLNLETCDLTDIVSAAVERLEPLLRGRPIDAQFPDEPMLVECDQAQVETVAVNLLENAVKYSPAGTPVHLRGAIAHGSALVFVRDEGPGVPDPDARRIFDKFYRTSTVGPVGGTGLGLAICRAVVEAHGGTVGVRNVPGAGAEFWFSLPLPLIDSGMPAEEQGEEAAV